MCVTLYALLLLADTSAAPPKVGPVPEGLRKEWKLSPFYKKHIDLRGFPLLSSEKVSDEALQEAAYLIEQMLAGRDDVRGALIKAKVRFAVMAPTEMTTDVPEHSDLTPKDYWDRRARGLGATRVRPAVSCGEENLLNLRGDRYRRENILIHEFAHAIHEMGLRRVDERFDARLRKCFDDATKKGLWKGTYAATNYKEYWAEAVQSYFDCNNPPDRQHNEANTREKLAKYDPDVYALIDETFKSTAWRYVRYDQRKKK
jgi:alpha-glucosidase